MPTIITGTRTANGGLAANEVPTIDNTLAIFKPYQTPLTQFMFFGNKKSKEVRNIHGKFSWMEREFANDYLEVTAAVSLTSGTLVFNSGNIDDVNPVRLNDIVYIEHTNEMAFVSAVTASTSFTLTHIDGSTTLTALDSAAIGSHLNIIFNLVSESDTLPTGISTQEEEKYNYNGYYTDSVQVTGRYESGQHYTDGMTLAEMVAEKIEIMKIKLEKYFIMSNASGIKSSSGADVTYGKGLNGLITTWVTNYAGALTETVFDDYLSDIGSGGSMRRKHYCGDAQYMDLQNIIKSKQGSFSAEFKEAYGVRFKTYIHGKLDVDIVRDPIMNGSKFSNTGFTIDPDNLKPRHQAPDGTGSRKFRIENNVGTPGSGVKAVKLMCDVGLQYVNEKTGGRLSH